MIIEAIHGIGKAKSIGIIFEGSGSPESPHRVVGVSFYDWMDEEIVTFGLIERIDHVEKMDETI